MIDASFAGWGLVLLAPLTALFVVEAALLERSSPIRLRHWAEEAGGALARIYENAPRFEALRLLLDLSAKILPVLTAWAAWRALGGWPWLVGRGAVWPALVALAAVIALLLFLEWLNHLLVERHSEVALRRLTVPVHITHLLLLPLIVALAPVVPHVANEEEDEDDEDEDDISDNELEAFIDVGRREGILEPDEEDLVRSIVDFGDTQVKRVMTPRVEIKSAPASESLEALADRFFETKHARLPIFNESIDQIIGILHIRDLFEALQKGVETEPARLTKEPFFVPETTSLPMLLRDLQERHQQMAIVIDEYGGVSGLVTVEDLVEEIVGDIADEHEIHLDDRMPLPGGGWRVSGRTELWELDDLFETDLDDVPYETVSGMIVGELGYVPEPGETLETHELAFTVEGADDRRVTVVAVAPANIELPTAKTEAEAK